jgi:hypothetical protein
VLALGGAVGQVMAVGSELIRWKSRARATLKAGPSPAPVKRNQHRLSQ